MNIINPCTSQDITEERVEHFNEILRLDRAFNSNITSNDPIDSEFSSSVLSDADSDRSEEYSRTREFFNYLINNSEEANVQLFIERCIDIMRSDDTSVEKEEGKFATSKLVDRHFTDKEKLDLEFGNLKIMFDLRRKLVDQSFSYDEVSKLLDLSLPEVSARINNNTLLAFENGDKTWCPSWQFDPLNAHGVVDGLQEVLSALDISMFAKVCWFNKPNKYLSNEQPSNMLKQGRKTEVMKAAQIVGLK